MTGSHSDSHRRRSGCLDPPPPIVSVASTFHVIGVLLRVAILLALTLFSSTPVAGFGDSDSAASDALLHPEGTQTLGMVAEFESTMRRLAAAGPPPAREAVTQGSQNVLPQGLLTNLSSGFIHFSSFRVGTHRYAVLGLGPANGFKDLHKSRKILCTWTNSDGSSSGMTFTTRPSIDTTDSMRLPLVTLVLFCDFSLPPTNGRHVEAHGWLDVAIGNDSFTPYAELEEKVVLPANSTGPFAHSLVFCSGPLHGALEPLSLRQWFQYHLVLGIDHALLYNVGALDRDQEDGARAYEYLSPFLDSGAASIVELGEVEGYNTWYHGQMLALHDCNFRLRNTAGWVIFGDLDEYLVPGMLPHRSLKSYLQEQQEQHRPWLSRGSYRYRDYCMGSSPWEEGRFAVEILQYRLVEPECSSSASVDPHLCLGSLGRRKAIVNPRMVEMLQIHRIQRLAPDALAFKDRALHLHVARELHNAHFSGITTKGRTCRRNYNLTQMAWSGDVVKILERVKECLGDNLEGLPKSGCTYP